MRVRLASDPVRQIGYATRMGGCRTAREARDRQVTGCRTAVDGAVPAGAGGAAPLARPVHWYKSTPEAVRVLRVIGRVVAVLGKRDGALHFVGPPVDGDREIEPL